MTLSRWRRIATGIAAGVIVLCAALLGASFRSDDGGVSVASELRPSVIIPIEEDPVDDAVEADATDDEVASVDATNDTEPADANDSGDDDVAPVDPSADDAAAADDDGDDATAGASDDEDESLSEPVTVIPDGAADGADSGATEASDADSSDAEADDTDPSETDSTDADTDAATEPAPAAPAAPLTSGDDNLGTGGGVDDAECALDRLVIYAGARVGGVASRIRAALNQAGFAAGCPTPVTVLASNCPLQFAGVLGAGSGYDPSKSFVASSANVDRETMTAVMGTVGFTGSQIDILDFGFVNPDRPGEQWMAIFVPPSFAGWENLASRAGLPITSQSLCAPSGQLAG